MNAKDILADLNLSIDRYSISKILDEEGHLLGVQSVILNKDNVSYSGGFGCDLQEANKIACAEFIERSMVKRYRSSELSRRRWFLDKHPTTCGFAVGFDKKKTILRSLCEGVERLVMSQWIDGQKPLDKVQPALSDLGNYFGKQFDSVVYYKAKLPVLVNKKLLDVSAGISIGQKDDGVFLGSNASLSEVNLWDHALLESFRHLLIFRNTPNVGRFPADRTHFFAKNKHIGLSSIPIGPPSIWRMPEILFFRVEPLPTKRPTYIARSIFKDWEPWHTGGVNRFLY